MEHVSGLAGLHGTVSDISGRTIVQEIKLAEQKSNVA